MSLGQKILEIAFGAAVVIVLLGALLGFSTDWVVPLFVSLVGLLLPGIVAGTIVGAVVGAITQELPPALLFGGVTATVLTIVLRIWMWGSTH